MIIPLRPHHGLCIQHFTGKGYSGQFVTNMTGVINTLRSVQPLIRLVCGADAICAACPHDQGGVCEHSDKVCGYDTRCLSMCGLAENDVLPWAEFACTVRVRILDRGRLREVCAGCGWLSICGML